MNVILVKRGLKSEHHSNEERIAKKILVRQTLNNRKIYWYNELKMTVKRMGLDLNMKVERMGLDLSMKVERMELDLRMKVERMGLDLSMKVQRMGLDLRMKVERMELYFCQNRKL